VFTNENWRIALHGCKQLWVILPRHDIVPCKKMLYSLSSLKSWPEVVRKLLENCKQYATWGNSEIQRMSRAFQIEVTLLTWKWRSWIVHKADWLENCSRPIGWRMFSTFSLQNGCLLKSYVWDCQQSSEPGPMAIDTQLITLDCHFLMWVEFMDQMLSVFSCWSSYHLWFVLFNLLKDNWYLQQSKQFPSLLKS